MEGSCDLHDGKFKVHKVNDEKTEICTVTSKLDINLKGFSCLWQTLKKLGFKKFSPGYVNQDTVEIFFGMIRSHNRRNINPTCVQFESSFKTLLINNLTSAKTVKGNCKDDEADVFSSLRNFALLAEECDNSKEESTEASNKAIDEDDNMYVLFPDVQSNRTGTCINNSRILMKLVKKIKSENCCDCISNLITFKNVDLLFEDAHSSLDGNIPFFCFKKDVVKNLIMPLQLILDFSFITYRTHVKTFIEQFTRIIAVEYVNCWCTLMNRLLKGKDSGATSQAYLSKLAITQYKKKLQIQNR